MNYHATLEDAKRFIIWFATSDTDVSDWDEKRYLDAVAMVRAIDSLHSRAPHEDLTAVLNENAIAQRYVSDANEEVNRLRAENAALRELVERQQLGLDEAYKLMPYLHQYVSDGTELDGMVQVWLDNYEAMKRGAK